jgi:hypothetical protein
MEFGSQLIAHRSRAIQIEIFGNCRIDKESQLNDNAPSLIESYPSPGLTAPEGRYVYRFSFLLDSSPGGGDM